MVEDGRAAEGERGVGTHGPAAGVDGAGLGRAVELELSVRGYVTRTADGVRENAVGKGDDEGAFAAAGYVALAGVLARGLQGGRRGSWEAASKEEGGLG